MDFRPLSSLLSDGPKIALMILNQPFDKSVLKALWDKSVYTAVTDGATNRLHEMALKGETEYVPNMISGDFDSVTPEALEYFRGKDGVEIVNTPDQDYTDFTKSLQLVVKKLEELKADVDHIVAMGAFGGKFDHCLANVNTLYTAKKLTRKPLVLMGEGNVACLLDQGRHILKMNTGMETKWCGLVPVGKPATSIYTTGLKYNLNGEGMAFGVLISTSNSLLEGKDVTVKTDEPLLWMQGYKEPTS